MSDYTKLSELVNDSFTINEVKGYSFKMYDPATKKILISDKWEKGYRKVYAVDTNRGTLDLSASQLGQILELFHRNGASDIVGATIIVKSNGKTGKEIRYFFNADYSADRVVERKDEVHEVDDEPINLDDIGM